MAEILLGYITPFQTSNWELHLRSLEKMLKWFYAYDYTYYAQNFTYCLVTQQNLGEQHPTIYGEFQKRNSGIKIAFILTRLLSKPWVRNRRDQVKLLGSAHHPEQRWVLASHVMADLTSKFTKKLVLLKNFGDLLTISSKKL